MKSADESGLLDISRVIIDSVYGALGSQLTADEAAQLAGELSTFIARSILEDMKTPVADVAFSAVDEFLKDQGIAGEGNEWHWMN